MNNFYCYFFYLTNVFLRKINKRNRDNMRAVALISGIQGGNLITLVYLMGYLPHYNRKPMILFSTFFCIPILLFNYWYFMYKENDKKIMSFYIEKYKYKNHNLITIFLVLAYYIGSLVYPFYLMSHK